jgi:type I restriction enzyme S subunit
MSKKGWRECKLGDLINHNIAELQTGPFGTMLQASEYKPSGIPVIAVQDIGQNRFNTEKLNYIDDTTVKRLERYKVQKDDIIFGRKGAVDRRAIVTDKEVGWIQGSDCIRLRLTGEIDSKFISYYLGSQKMKDWLFQYSHGATMPSLNQEILALIPLFLPPLPEQKAIASILSSLDDKIDLLHRQNKTLEAMAETLFRQWFVEEAAEGWEEGKLGDILELAYGKGLKGEIRTEKGYPVVGSSGVVGYHSDFLVEGPGIVIGRKGTLGKVMYLYTNFFPIDTTYYVKSKINSPGLFYEYFLLKTIGFEDMNSDSAVPGLNRDIALSTETSIPPNEIRVKFCKICTCLMEKIWYNEGQIDTLVRTRDTLLPKLMSGEVGIEK